MITGEEASPGGEGRVRALGRHSTDRTETKTLTERRRDKSGIASGMSRVAAGGGAAESENGGGGGQSDDAEAGGKAERGGGGGGHNRADGAGEGARRQDRGWETDESIPMALTHLSAAD